MLGQNLAYVALAVRDVDTATHVFSDQLGLKAATLESGQGDRVAVVAIGDSALALYPVGHPDIGGATSPGVHHIALGVDNLDTGLELAAGAGLPVPDGPPIPGLGGHERIALEPAHTAHVATWLTKPLDIDPAAAPLVERLDHLGIASADNLAAVDVWSGRLGCRLESQQTDMEVMIPVESFTSDRYGVVYHTRDPIPVGGLRVSFISVGDTELEFLQNFDPNQRGQVDHGTAGNTRQDQGVIARYVANRGPGLHHLAFKTPDIDAVFAALDAAGVPLIDKKGRPGSRGGLIGFIHPKGTGGVLVHFDERQEANSDATT